MQSEPCLECSGSVERVCCATAAGARSPTQSVADQPDRHQKLRSPEPGPSLTFLQNSTPSEGEAQHLWRGVGAKRTETATCKVAMARYTTPRRIRGQGAHSTDRYLLVVPCRNDEPDRRVNPGRHRPTRPTRRSSGQWDRTPTSSVKLPTCPAWSTASRLRRDASAHDGTPCGTSQPIDDTQPADR